MMHGPVLVSWVAVNNDPFERDWDTGQARLVDGERVPGPTLTLLSDPDSPYADHIEDVVLFHRPLGAGGTERERRAFRELADELTRRELRVRDEIWSGTDPTDHRVIFDFLRKKLPEIRARYAGRELVLHISPGTPSMHTVWVLMAETGFVEPPFSVVKSYRKTERRGRPAVVPVELGIETFYKTYKASRPRQVGSQEQGVIWDPARFRTPQMKRVYATARRFAQLNVPVLIRGERGTGKTTLASWIRSASPFKRDEQNASWPSVACGQYDSGTMRGELFGYAKGAFTGASSDKTGLLAAAHRDTLFLDEVGDVSRELQRLLIRAIEEKRYFALGDDRPRTSDFRLLTATNVDDATLRERLDPDFLDRISMVTLELPPLRQVRDELPWLWQTVYDTAVKRTGVASASAHLESRHHQELVVKLQQHPLAGNLRDLFRVAYRVLAARVDVEEPASPDEAVAFGLEALKRGSSPQRGGSAARAVAGAFAERAPLDEILETGCPLDTGELFLEMKAYIASEVRRLANLRDVDHKELCDVSVRSLRTWAKGGDGDRQARSDSRNDASD